MRTCLRTSLIFVGITLLVLAGGCSKQPKQQEGAVEKAAEPVVKQGPPKIVVDEKSYDFGKVKEGTNVEHVYKIKNEGEGELVIENVRSSCGCTVAQPTSKNVPPGGESEIKATFRTAGRGGKTRKTITVKSNDPVTPTLVLSIQGEIETDVAVKPRSIWLGQLKKRTKGTADFTVEVSDPERIKVTSVKVEDRAFTIKKLEGDAAGTAKYQITFRGGVKLGPISTRVLVEYEGAEKSPLRVPVRVEVVGDLQYTKYLRFIKRNDSFQPMTIVFKSRTDKDVTIKSANDPQGLLKLTVLEGKGKRPMIRAEVADPAASYQSPRRNNIVVQTSDRDEPKVEIGYTIVEPRAPAVRPTARPLPPRKSPPPRPGPAAPPLPAKKAPPAGPSPQPPPK